RTVEQHRCPRADHPEVGTRLHNYVELLRHLLRLVDIASHDGENDWGRDRRMLRGDGRGPSDRDQNVGIVCYQRCRIFVEALVPLRCEDLFEHEGPTFDMPEIAGALQLRRIEYTFLFGIAGVPKNNHFWEAGSSSGRGRLQDLDAMPIHRAVAGPKAVNPYFSRRY